MLGEDIFNGHDETQIELMKEECILIDEDDRNKGSASKKECHLLENINKGMQDFKIFTTFKVGRFIEYWQIIICCDTQLHIQALIHRLKNWQLMKA